ncbi:PaaX family transcriptional regulator C-terminal domain-containing protein [Roseibium sp.]|uniref:PaaX family transcriptional regulator C-terminal domain-containing protein n=1 Tax=Roseibium sp. TaxID=1936156 RepID=UPI003A973B22
MLQSTGQTLLEDVLRRVTIRAGSFIVTIYGDVVEPRGGELWMGNLIEICDAVGISETLVRTAVSRLVSAGQLTSEKVGRRSYYRLTKNAQREFAEASRILFRPVPETKGWLFAVGPEQNGGGEPADGFVKVGPNIYAAPDLGNGWPDGGAVFRAETVHGLEKLPDFARTHWDVAGFGASYKAFIKAFTPLKVLLDQEQGLPGHDSLVLRLALVHAYRMIALRDPRLPKAALGEDWPGEEARLLFGDLYLRLSTRADAFVARSLVNAGGALTEDSTVVCGRRESLSNIFTTI